MSFVRDHHTSCQQPEAASGVADNRSQQHHIAVAGVDFNQNGNIIGHDYEYVIAYGVYAKIMVLTIYCRQYRSLNMLKGVI